MKIKLSTPFKKLRFQMYAPILVLVFLMSGTALFLIYTTTSKFKDLDRKIKETSVANLQLQRFSRYSAATKDAVLLYLTTKDEKYLKEIRELNNNIYFKNDSEIFYTTNPSTDLALALTRDPKDSGPLIEAMLKNLQSKSPAETAQFFKTYTALSETNKTKIETLAAQSEAELNKLSNQMQIILDNSIGSFVFILIFVVFLLVVIAIAYSNQIYQPMIDLKRGFGELIRGRFPRLKKRPDISNEVDEMFGDFNRMTEHLETSRKDLLKAQKDALRLAEIKSNFLSNMSHEIRTPLNSIIGLADLLSELKLPDPASKYVSGLAKNSTVLLSLINDILDYSRLESGKIQLEDTVVNLPQLMDRVLSVIKPATDKKGITLKMRLDPYLPKFVMGDPLRLEQVLLNLLSNAVKFTDRGEIVLGARVFDGKPETFGIFVRDSGIGISKKVLPKLFERFNQGEKTVTKKYGGTGLGLAIVRQYIELMKGKVHVESEQGKGSMFTIELPLRVASEKIDTPTRLRIAPENLEVNGRILLVDDSVDNRELVKVYLKDAHVELTEACDGIEAIELFKKNEYDLVLLDMQMPEVDGYTAAIRMRNIEKEQSRIRRTPILAFTAFALAEELRKAHQSGCDGHVVKPVKKRELIHQLQSYLGEGGGPMLPNFGPQHVAFSKEPET